MSDAKLEAYFFSAIFLLTLVFVGMLFYPFLGSLALAMVLATLSTPLYNRILSRVHHPHVTAVLVTLLVALAIVLPAIGIFYLLLEEIHGVSMQVTIEQLRTFPLFFVQLHDLFFEAFPFLQKINLSELLQSFTNNIGLLTASAVTGTTELILKFFIALIAFYYFILDGKHFINELIKLSPLDNAEDRAIIEKLSVVTHSIVRGTLVVATLQGLLVGFGLLVFNVPNPVLWGCVAAIAALVPTLGTGIVSFPVILYLFATGQLVAAVGYAAWSAFIVGMIDNVVGPKLIGDASHMHPLFVLLSVLGGLSFFGLSGFFLGPLIFGFLIALAEIYKIKIKEIHEHSM